jgi:hypothetical protein
MKHKDKLVRDTVAEMTAGALRYAAAEKSDPFAFARAMTHINNGIAQFTVNRENQRPSDGYYDAEPIKVDAFYVMNGETIHYKRTEYKNIARP